MRPILFITDANFLSHLLRCIEIAKTLRSRGEEVLFAASGIYENLLGHNGFKHYPVWTNEYHQTMDITRSSTYNYYKRERLNKCVKSEISVLKQIQPKVVVGDFRWTLRLSAEYCKVPYVAIINAVWTPYYSFVKSIPENLVLDKMLGNKLVNSNQPKIYELMMYERGKSFNRLREELGITPLNNLNLEMCGEYNLVPDIPELFPTKNLPDNFEYIGPLFSKTGSLPVPEKPVLPSEPYIYISIGSTATTKMIKIVFDAFKREAIPVVMTTGKQKIDLDVPSNFYLFDYLSAKQAFKNALMIICHGGQGTLYQALSYGVPIIGIATLNDQQWNLDRIENFELGIKFGEDVCSAEEINNAYKEIKSNDKYKKNCLRMRNISNSYDTLNLAANAIIRWSRKNKFRVEGHSCEKKTTHAS